jgi:hypothetical protein
MGSVGTVVVLVLYDREYDSVGSGKKRMIEYLLVGSRLVGSSKDGDLKTKQEVFYRQEQVPDLPVDDSQASEGFLLERYSWRSWEEWRSFLLTQLFSDTGYPSHLTRYCFFCLKVL